MAEREREKSGAEIEWKRKYTAETEKKWYKEEQEDRNKNKRRLSCANSRQQNVLTTNNLLPPSSNWWRRTASNKRLELCTRPVQTMRVCLHCFNFHFLRTGHPVWQVTFLNDTRWEEPTNDRRSVNKGRRLPFNCSLREVHTELDISNNYSSLICLV